MTWSKDIPQGDESSKIRWELVPYFRGTCLDLGCGPWKVFPHFIGVDSGKAFGQVGADVYVKDAQKLDIFATQCADLVYSSHLLEHIPYEDVPATLNEWLRVVKVGGHLVCYLPDEDEYPKVGEKGANPDHKWNVSYDRFVAALEQSPYPWNMVDFQKRNAGDEYSLFFVLQKL